LILAGSNRSGLNDAPLHCIPLVESYGELPVTSLPLDNVFLQITHGAREALEILRNETHIPKLTNGWKAIKTKTKIAVTSPKEKQIIYGNNLTLSNY
jgi:hypothetical protein